MTTAVSVRARLGVLAVMIFTNSGLVTAESSVRAYLIGDVLQNAAGGRQRGSALLVDAGLTIDTDASALFGRNDARLFAYLLWNNASTFSTRYPGDLQVASNIDTGDALRLYEIWYEQALSESVSLRFGLYDLNSEFDVIDTAALFLNSSHGIGAEYGASGRNGPSIFPVTSLAARLAWQHSASGRLRYALLDGVPGDPARPERTTIDLGGSDGVLHALQYDTVLGSETRVGIGAWRYSTGVPRIAAEAPSSTDADRGLYGFVDSRLYRSASGMRINAFLRYGSANDAVNPLRRYLGAGVVFTGLFRGRPEDRLGVAVASAGFGDVFRAASPGQRRDRSETSVELTYSARLADWVRVQPDIQYIVNPAGDPALDDALVIGLRFEFSVSRQRPLR